MVKHRKFTNIIKSVASTFYALLHWSILFSQDDVIIKTVLSALPMLRHNYNASFPSHDMIQACFELLGMVSSVEYIRSKIWFSSWFISILSGHFNWFEDEAFHTRGESLAELSHERTGKISLFYDFPFFLVLKVLFSETEDKSVCRILRY